MEWNHFPNTVLHLRTPARLKVIADIILPVAYVILIWHHSSYYDNILKWSQIRLGAISSVHSMTCCQSELIFFKIEQVWVLISWQTVEQAVELAVIWDARTCMWRHCKATFPVNECSRFTCMSEIWRKTQNLSLIWSRVYVNMYNSIS